MLTARHSRPPVRVWGIIDPADVEGWVECCCVDGGSAWRPEGTRTLMSGRVVHFEIPSDDLTRAQSFYRDAFGWEINSIPGWDTRW